MARLAVLRRVVRGAFALLLAATVLLAPMPGTTVLALSLPWRTGADDPGAAIPGGAALPLQEVPPPAAVQQLQQALADRQPVVEILSPRDDTILEGRPWRLSLRVHDWPLVNAGALGVGPHLVAQLDQQPPRILTDTELEMPPLSPGSHRLTVYAALPWGEAHKNPGAVQQIRLHRTAANPLSLPARGSPQLLAVSPPARAGDEPLLLDWLLLDAPLQDVGGSGTQWRLRVSINGDDVLLEQQSPLWLRGWKPGVNALKLDLLDGRGDPLNPPFNALVQEVDRSSPPPPRPRWSGERLSAAELAVLLGQTPAPPAVPALQSSPASGTDSREAAPPTIRDNRPAAAEPAPTAPQPSPAKTSNSESAAEADAAEEAKAAIRDAVPAAPTAMPQSKADAATLTTPTTTSTGTALVDPGRAAAQDKDDGSAAAVPTEPRLLPAPAVVPSIDGDGETEVTRPDSSLGGRARDLVNDDGTLKRPERPGPLASLREKLLR